MTINHFDHPVKSKQEEYEKLIEMTRNKDYATENLLDFSYHQNCYRLTGIDLSRQKVLLNKLIVQKD